MGGATLILLFGLMVSQILAFPSPSSKRSSSASREANQIKHAVFAWQQDTGIVSNFLNQAQARDFSGQAAYHHAASGALAAELNELVHKAVLDKDLPHTPEVENANTTLVTDGDFESVVQLLTDLTHLNFSTDRGEIRKDINHINFGNATVGGRCFGVLPAIDEYFNAAAKQVEKLDGSKVLFGVSAIRPTACETAKARAT